MKKAASAIGALAALCSRGRLPQPDQHVDRHADDRPDQAGRHDQLAGRRRHVLADRHRAGHGDRRRQGAFTVLPGLRDARAAAERLDRGGPARSGGAFSFEFSTISFNGPIVVTVAAQDWNDNTTDASVTLQYPGSAVSSFAAVPGSKQAHFPGRRCRTRRATRSTTRQRHVADRDLRHRDRARPDGHFLPPDGARERRPAHLPAHAQRSRGRTSSQLRAAPFRFRS